MSLRRRTGDPVEANQGNSFEGGGDGHDDGLDFAEGVSFHNDNPPPAPVNDLEGIRELEEDFTAVSSRFTLHVLLSLFS